ncbi:hypothetical protein C8J57DRAFT_1480653 [Mycena rebaudengoi]|nr:hypothetical protein C8J57DRAFT_1480653 [Mycena rebaudengoi]
MAPQGWTNSTQLTWLKSKVTHYMDMQAQGKLHKFWPWVYEAWFHDFPEHAALNFPLPNALGDAPALTGEQMDALGAAIKARKGQLQNWFRHQRTKLRSAGPTVRRSEAAMANALFGKKKKERRHQPIELFQKAHKATIRSALTAAGYDAITVGNSDWVDDTDETQMQHLKIQNAERMRLRAKVVQGLYSAIPESERAMFVDTAGAEKAKGKYQPSLFCSRESPCRMWGQWRAGQGSPVVGGPNPSYGGELSMRVLRGLSVCLGVSPAGHDFRKAHPDFDAAITGALPELPQRCLSGRWPPAQEVDSLDIRASAPAIEAPTSLASWDHRRRFGHTACGWTVELLGAAWWTTTSRVAPPPPWLTDGDVFARRCTTLTMSAQLEGVQSTNRKRRAITYPGWARGFDASLLSMPSHGGDKTGYSAGDVGFPRDTHEAFVVRAVGVVCRVQEPANQCLLAVIAKVVPPLLAFVGNSSGKIILLSYPPPPPRSGVPGATASSTSAPYILAPPPPPSTVLQAARGPTPVGFTFSPSVPSTTASLAPSVPSTTGTPTTATTTARSTTASTVTIASAPTATAATTSSLSAAVAAMSKGKAAARAQRLGAAGKEIFLAVLKANTSPAAQPPPPRSVPRALHRAPRDSCGKRTARRPAFGTDVFVAPRSHTTVAVDGDPRRRSSAPHRKTSHFAHAPKSNLSKGGKMWALVRRTAASAAAAAAAPVLGKRCTRHGGRGAGASWPTGTEEAVGWKWGGDADPGEENTKGAGGGEGEGGDDEGRRRGVKDVQLPRNEGEAIRAWASNPLQGVFAAQPAQ